MSDRPDCSRTPLLATGASESKRPFRVLLVIGSLQLGGAERQISLLATGLARRGCEVSLFALEGSGPLAAALIEGGVRVLDGGYRKAAGHLIKPLLLVRGQARLLTLLLRLRPQVVHAFLPLTSFMAAVAGRAAGVDVIVTGRRALGTHQDRRPFWRPMDRVAARLSHAVTANSRAVAADAARRDRICPERMHVIHNAIDTERFHPDSATAVQVRAQLGLTPYEVAIGCVANLIAYKGHAELIEAFAEVSSRASAARLFLIGRDDGMQARLAARVRSLGLQERVSFLGARTDVERLLTAMDIGVLASHEEGFPNALMEMLAVGMPVVATGVGGVPELLENMPDCLTVPSRQREPLARALEQAVAQLARSRTHAAERSTRIARCYGVEPMVDTHLRLYSSLLGDRSVSS